MNLNLQFYWGLFLKRLPVMLAMFLICAVSASVTALKMPPTYSTSAKLSVEEAQITASTTRAEDEIDAGEQLQVIEQKLLTRANMLNIARKYSVFENIRTMTPDAIVERMSRQTIIARTGRRRDEATLMSVSFEARSPQIAANVVNEYVTLILQENTKFRMGRAESTLDFFEQEVERLSDDLDQQSARIVSFKNENSNALPSDLNYRKDRQTLLLERQGRLERDIAALQTQRRDMKIIFDATGQVSNPNVKKLSPEEQQLEQLQLDLQQALGVYSETNPRVVLLRNRVRQMEETLQKQVPASSTPEAEEQGPVSALDLSLAEMDQRQTSLEDELSDVSEELTALSISIQATAGNAISLDALERDFENVQNRYNEALENLNAARVNERIEVSAQGQRISVIENANVPQDPSGPNRFMLIAMGVAAGGGLAVGYFMLLELLNRAIRSPNELQSKFGIIPLAIIPYMESRRERMLRRAALISAFLAVLVGVPAALWYIDTNYMPLDILANMVFDRLGLT